jgi:VanZ family protein
MNASEIIFNTKRPAAAYWYQKILAYTLLTSIVVGSFLSPKAVSTLPLPGTDKLHHGSAYFLLSLAFLWPYRNQPVLSWWKIIFTLAFLGGIIEPLQPIISPGRSCDIYDFVADCAGIGLAVLMLAYYARRRLNASEK